MSKQPTKTATAPKPRATFAAASFATLRASIGEGQGEALRLILADIIEDPGQPRKVFDPAELESLAESIKLKGVVQPIVVRPAVDGRYMLAFGARRVRAAKLAGAKDIPAVIRAKSDDDFTAQLIENQHRANLANSELAASIEQLAAAGYNNKQIANICNLKDYQVAAFKQAGNFPPELRDRMDNADMRALYDLFRQWGKTPAEVIDALPDADTFITVTEARRIVGSITGKPTGSIVLDRQAAAATTPPIEQRDPAGDETDGTARQGFDFSRPKPSPAPAPPSAPETANGGEPATATVPAEEQATPKAAGKGRRTVVSVAPTFIVQGKGATQGALVVDRKAEREGWALVRFPTGTEEVALDELRIVRID
jgi:ParB family chromosome partitioning protein